MVSPTFATHVHLWSPARACQQNSSESLVLVNRRRLATIAVWIKFEGYAYALSLSGGYMAAANSSAQS